MISSTISFSTASTAARRISAISKKVAVNWAENGITTPKQAAAQTNSAPRAGGKKAGKNGTAGSFGSFEQRSYDWNELEKKILGS